MAKNADAFRRVLDNYPFNIEIPTRFQDLDTQKHINNVAVAGLYEESRVQFHREKFRELRKNLKTKTQYRTVLADVHINYLREAHYPYPVTVGVGVGHVGNTSYSLHCSMFQKGECIGLSEAVVVFSQSDQTLSIPDGVREVLNENLIAN